MAQHRHQHGQAAKKKRSKVIWSKATQVKLAFETITYPTPNVARRAIKKLGFGEIQPKIRKSMRKAPIYA